MLATIRNVLHHTMVCPVVSDEIPIIARRELVERPITVMIHVGAADAISVRASQALIVAEMARAIDRASRNR
jgi:hypothetical protein